MSTVNNFGDLESLRTELFGDGDETPDTPETPAVEVVETTNENIEEVDESGTKATEVADVWSKQDEAESEEASDEPKPEVKPEPKNRANERIRELNDKAKTEKARADHLEQELNRIRERQAELDKLTEGAEADLDPNKFESMDEYIKAVTDAKVAKAVEARDRQQLEQESAKTIQAYEQSIANTFEANVAKYAEVNPNITKAVEHLNKYAEYIPPEVRLALLTDENGAQIAWDIATSSELLEAVTKGNSAQSIKLIGKLSAKYDAPNNTSKSDGVIKPLELKDDVKPSVVTKPSPVVPAIPKVNNNGSNADRKSARDAWKEYQTTGKRPW